MRQLSVLLVIFGTPTVAADFRAIDIGQSCQSVREWELAHGSTQNLTHAEAPLEVYSFNTEELGRRISVRYMCRSGKLYFSQSVFPLERWSRAVQTYREASDSLKLLHGEPSTQTPPRNEIGNEQRAPNNWSTPISVWKVSGTKLVLMIAPNQPSKPELDEWHVTISLGFN